MAAHDSEMVNIKTEDDIFEDTLAPSSEIKDEIPIDIKAELDEAINMNSNLEGVIIEPLSISNTMKTNSQLVESFVIFELDSVGSQAEVEGMKPIEAEPVVATKQGRGSEIIKVRKSKVALRKAALFVPSKNGITPTSNIRQRPIPNAIVEQNSRSKINVKCLCRLGSPLKVEPTLQRSIYLKQLFEEMFNETRQLPQSRQRTVKMLLLTALTDAELAVEEGKNCVKCCP